MRVPARGRRRQEGREKVTGATRFAADLEIPRLLHVGLVLSPIAAGSIRGIDVEAARRAPGVVDVVTGSDLRESTGSGPDKPLAVDRVYYVGQPVVAVLAESEALAADAAALVSVEYDETPPVVDPVAAMRDGAALVLDEEEGDGGEDASLHGASAADDHAAE